jgi:hypothetical protein
MHVSGSKDGCHALFITATCGSMIRRGSDACGYGTPGMQETSGKPAGPVEFTAEDEEVLLQLAEYAAMVVSAQERRCHKQKHLDFTFHLDSAAHAFLRVRMPLKLCPLAPNDCRIHVRTCVSWAAHRSTNNLHAASTLILIGDGCTSSFILGIYGMETCQQ